MFLFVSYTLPSTPYSTYCTAFQWSYDRLTQGVTSLMNEAYPDAGITSDNLINWYLSSEPCKGEDVWRYIMRDGKVLNRHKQEVAL